MFDIVHNFNVLLCFNQGSNTINETISTGQQSVDSAARPEDHGAPQQPHPSGVQPQDVPVTEAHDGKMVVY
jgi:hypothetical protein